MAINHWPANERPREKLLARGADALSDAELLAIFLRTGIPGRSAVDLARDLIVRFGGLRGLFNASQHVFCDAPGLGQAKYAQLQAVLAMSERYLAEQLVRGDAIAGAQGAGRYLGSRLRNREREVFAVLLLDSQHRMISYEELFEGTIDRASVHPREVVKRALHHNAAALILAHNHPSGVAEPSMADRQITEQLVEALALVGVRVLDHLVVGDGAPVSFAERGWL